MYAGCTAYRVIAGVIVIVCKFEIIMTFFFLYIDPGSGSYLVQAIIAAVLGAGFFFKSFWVKIKSFFVKPKPEQEEEDI
jgi:type IV secretory pathway VirB3-like protein